MSNQDDDDKTPEVYGTELNNDADEGWEDEDDENGISSPRVTEEKDNKNQFVHLKYVEEYEYNPKKYGEIRIKAKNKRYIACDENGKIKFVKSLDYEDGAFINTPNEDGSRITLKSRSHGFYLSTTDGKQKQKDGIATAGINDMFYFKPNKESMGKFSFKSQNDQWIYFAGIPTLKLYGSKKQRTRDHKFFIINTFTDTSADNWNTKEINESFPLQFGSSNTMLTFAGEQHKKRRKRPFTNVFGEQIIAKGFIKKWTIKIIPNVPAKERWTFKRIKKTVTETGELFKKVYGAMTDPEKAMDALEELNAFDIAENVIEKLQAKVKEKKDKPDANPIWQKAYDKLELLKDREQLKKYGSRIIKGSIIFLKVVRCMEGDPSAFMSLLAEAKFVMDLAEDTVAGLIEKVKLKAESSDNKIWGILKEKLDLLMNIKEIKKYGKMIIKGGKMFMKLMEVCSGDPEGFISLIEDFDIDDIGKEAIDAIQKKVEEKMEKGQEIWKKINDKLKQMQDPNYVPEETNEDKDKEDKKEDDNDDDNDDDKDKKKKEYKPEMYYEKADITVGIQSVDGRVNKWYGYVGRTGKKATGNSKKMHKKGSTKGYGRSFRLNDEISIELDMNKYLLGFYINNDYQEKAFKVDPKGAYRLFVRINSTDYSIQFVDEEEEDF